MILSNRSFDEPPRSTYLKQIDSWSFNDISDVVSDKPKNITDFETSPKNFFTCYCS